MSPKLMLPIALFVVDNVFEPLDSQFEVHFPFDWLGPFWL